VIRSSETSVYAPTTQLHIPDDRGTRPVYRITPVT
jgi:hypothetical protein